MQFEPAKARLLDKEQYLFKHHGPCDNGRYLDDRQHECEQEMTIV